MKQREIKFRGKLVNSNEWVYGYLYQDETGTYIKEPEKNKRFGTGFKVIPESVGQFSGLLDKNGKDIYEGDIIEFNESDKLKDGTYLRLRVSWIADNQSLQWGFKGLNSDNRVSLSFIHCKQEEVIGNIYEHPELISKGSVS